MGKDSTLPNSDILKLVVGEHNATAGGNLANDPDPQFFKVGGKYVAITAAAPTAVEGADAVVLWLDQRGYITPHVETLLIDSFTTATGSATGTTVSGMGVFRDLDVILTVTLGTGTTPTLDFFLDSQLDGTNWTNSAHATQITGTGTRVLHLTKRDPAADVQGSGDVGAGTVRALGWGNTIRSRRDITGTAPSFSATIYLNGIG